MTNGSPMKLILGFSVPLLFGFLFQQFYNLMDTLIVGRFLGVDDLAAVGSTGSVNFLIIGFCMGVCNGFAIPLAHKFGAGDYKGMRGFMMNAIYLSAIFAVVMTIVTVIFCMPILELMRTPENIIDGAYRYIVIIFWGIPVTYLYNLVSGIIRSMGDSRTPVVFLVIAAVINIGLDLFFIVVLGTGVEGAAWATVISQLISCILVLWCLYKSEGSYQLRFSKLQIKGVYLKQIFQVGIPAGIQSMIINFSNVLLQSSVNSFGSTAMAGYTAANNILGFLYAAVNSITQACMSFTSQNYGVGKYKRMDKVLIDCLILTVVVAGVLGCGSYLLGPEILRIYTEEEKVIRCGMEILSITTVPYFLCGIMDLFPGALRGMGYSAVPMILSIIGTVGMRVVWIFGIFPHYRSLYVLFISYPGSWLFTIIMQVICFYFVRKKIHQM